MSKSFSSSLHHLPWLLKEPYLLFFFQRIFHGFSVCILPSVITSCFSSPFPVGSSAFVFFTFNWKLVLLSCYFLLVFLKAFLPKSHCFSILRTFSETVSFLNVSTCTTVDSTTGQISVNIKPVSLVLVYFGSGNPCLSLSAVVIVSLDVLAV